MVAVSPFSFKWKIFGCHIMALSFLPFCFYSFPFIIMFKLSGVYMWVYGPTCTNSTYLKSLLRFSTFISTYKTLQECQTACMRCDAVQATQDAMFFVLLGVSSAVAPFPYLKGNKYNVVKCLIHPVKRRGFWDYILEYVKDVLAVFSKLLVSLDCFAALPN